MFFDTVATCASNYTHKHGEVMSYLKLSNVGFMSLFKDKLMYITE